MLFSELPTNNPHKNSRPALKPSKSSWEVINIAKIKQANMSTVTYYSETLAEIQQAS